MNQRAGCKQQLSKTTGRYESTSMLLSPVDPSHSWLRSRPGAREDGMKVAGHTPPAKARKLVPVKNYEKNFGHLARKNCSPTIIYREFADMGFRRARQEQEPR